MRSSVGADVQRRLASKNLRRPVARVVVQEWPAAFKFVFEASNPFAARVRILVIFSAHSEPNPVAGGHHNGSRPDLNVKLDNLAGSQQLHFIMGVIRAVRSAQLRIELAMRRAQPALTDGRVRVDGALEHDFVSAGDCVAIRRSPFDRSRSLTAGFLASL